jgi:hypothetical protein
MDEEYAYILAALVFLVIAYFLWRKYQQNKQMREQYLAEDARTLENEQQEHAATHASELTASEPLQQGESHLDEGLTLDLCSLEDNPHTAQAWHNSM